MMIWTFDIGTPSPLRHSAFSVALTDRAHSLGHRDGDPLRTGYAGPRAGPVAGQKVFRSDCLLVERIAPASCVDPERRTPVGAEPHRPVLGAT
jgi:hypothetical protein